MDVARAVKHSLDRLFAIVLLVLASPLLLLLALAIRIESPGSVVFLQERIGRGGRPFTIFKFRTMRNGTEKEGLGAATAADDERITKVGSWLRRTGLDELPQLLNIALGEMSFVGPRPTLRHQVEAYTPRQRRRLLFRPGLTGWAQIHGRNALTWPDRIELDLHYIRHYSLWLDLVILWRTLRVVLSGEGAYAACGANDDYGAATATPAAAAAASRVDTPGDSGVPPLVVVGAGGHARVVIDAIEKQGSYRVAGVLDDAPGNAGRTVMGYAVLGGREVAGTAAVPARAVVAIGSPAGRSAWLAHLAALGYELPVVVHPHAQVGRDVELGAGTVLLAGAIVNSGARLGQGVIVNTSASVDHDCRLGDVVHIAPGARLAGNVSVGERSHVGIGACVIQGVQIGADAVIGAGAAVVGPIPAGATAVGVPARVLHGHDTTATAAAARASAPRP